jgi:hypothetical protein
VLPTIGTVLSAELIRDGGSLCASFVGTDSASYWLFFKLVIVDTSPGYREAKHYATPVIGDRLSGTSISITWDHAKAMLSEISSLLSKPTHHEAVDSMLDIAQNEGQITANVRAKYECLQGPRRWFTANDFTAKV